MRWETKKYSFDSLYHTICFVAVVWNQTCSILYTNASDGPTPSLTTPAFQQIPGVEARPRAISLVGAPKLRWSDGLAGLGCLRQKGESLLNRVIRVGPRSFSWPPG